MQISLKLDYKLMQNLKKISLVLSVIIASLIVVLGYIFYYPKYMFHTLISIAIIVGCGPLALVIHLESRRKKLIDNALPRLLEDLAESQEAGMTLLQALAESSKRKYGPINEELKILVSQLTWGVQFEEAFRSFSRRIGTQMTSRVTVLLLEAVRLGGDLKTTFKSTSTFVRKMIELRNERETQLRPFMMVIYISTMIFVLIVVIIYQSLFVQMSSISSSFFKLDLNIETYKAYLFDLAIIEAILGGFTAGKLSEGVTLYGLKHSIILLLAVTIVFTFFF